MNKKDYIAEIERISIEMSVLHEASFVADKAYIEANKPCEVGSIIEFTIVDVREGYKEIVKKAVVTGFSIDYAKDVKPRAVILKKNGTKGVRTADVFGFYKVIGKYEAGERP